jgi:hypothetical protein
VLVWTAGRNLLCLCELQGANFCACVDCRQKFVVLVWTAGINLLCLCGLQQKFVVFVLTAGSNFLCLCGLQGAIYCASVDCRQKFFCVCVDCREQLANCVADTPTMYAIMTAYMNQHHLQY